MAQQLPAAPEKAAPAADPRGLVPPDEAFWVRYSPHAEMPLSGVSSFALHALIFGLLLLCAYPLSFLFNKPVHQVPVEAVRFDVGGGGGNLKGEGDGPGGPRTRPPEEVGGNETNPQENPSKDPLKQPELDRPRLPELAKQYNPESLRILNQPNPPPNITAFTKLSEDARKALALGPRHDPGKGRGGEGSGGGAGSGRGTGEGNATGEGKANLTQREKRMLRWTMLFTTENGNDYLKQLRGLGAILAIPVKEAGGERDYKIVRDLSSKPAELLTEDIGKIQRIYWIDDKPGSVAQMMTALGLTIRPSHFVAFMPEKLEDQLFDLEKKAAKGRSEDQIAETRFKVKRVGDRYEPELTHISFK
jgi:hypothetical protein